MGFKFSKKTLFLFYALLFVLIVTGPLLLGLLSDWLWFRELRFGNIFTTILGTRLLLFLVSSILTFFLLYLNFKISNDESKKYQFNPITIRFSENLERVDLEKYVDKIAVGFFAFVSLLFGFASSDSWQTVLEFFNSTKFGSVDPIFNRDISYYFFSLPFVKILFAEGFVVLIIALIVSSVVFVLRGSISYNRFSRGISAAGYAKTQLSILIAALFLLLSARIYFIDIPELLYSVNSQFVGAGYADIHAQLPILKLLAVIAVICSILALIGIKQSTNKLIVFAIALFFGVNILGSTIYPSLVQRFVVAPNELSKESPYITNNIEATRKAWGIDKVVTRNLGSENSINIKDIVKNESTVKNIRLWDRDPLLDTFGQLQSIRTYYDFVSVDNDRYMINDEYRQVMLSARELNSDALPNPTFINEQLVFTHGMGLTLGPVNQVTEEGLPVLLIKDLPPISSVKSLNVTRPEIYFGEKTSSPVIAKTKSKEFNYPSGDKNVFSTYKGRGGVQLSTFLRKLLFAVQFGKLPILLSSDITKDSRIMYNRNILERVRKAFPFLSFDADPYMVIDNGDLKWIYDAYTISDRYPYSQSSVYNSNINYMRNSVKLVIDAYEGNIDAYISDKSDPIIRTYAKIFPKVFKPLSDMPETLKKHLRYPEDIFAHQSALYSTYHMEKADALYNKEDKWEIPQLKEGDQMDPIMRHLIMKLPQEKSEEFILMIPYTPGQKNNLSAWLAARSDGKNYGQLVVYRFPKQSLVYGPKQIIDRINQDAEISRQISLWDQRGSEVILGNLLVIPIEESLIYVQSLYLRAEGGKIPELKRIIVAYKNSIAMEDTLQKSIDKIFGVPQETVDTGVKPSDKESAALLEKETLAVQAQNHYKNAIEAQRKGDWTKYGEELKRLEEVLNKLK